MAKKIKVLLVGTNGIIGSSLSQTLPGKDLKLTLVSRNKVRSKLPFIQHSASDPIKVLLKKLKGNFDVLILNAGNTKNPETFKEHSDIFEVNTKYVLDLLELAKIKKVKKIIFSSTFAFLHQPFEKPITEEHPIGAYTFYGASKYLAETAVTRFCKENNIDYFCFRIPSPVNTGNISLHTNVLNTWITKAKKEKCVTIYSEGKRHQNFIDTKDIALVYSQAIFKKRRSGIYNLASASSISMKDLAGMIAKKFKADLAFDLSKPEEISYHGISLEKLKKEFKTRPLKGSKLVVQELLNSIK